MLLESAAKLGGSSRRMRRIGRRLEELESLNLLEDALSAGQGLDFEKLFEESKLLEAPAGRVFFFFALRVFLLVVLCTLSM